MFRLRHKEEPTSGRQRQQVELRQRLAHITSLIDTGHIDAARQSVVTLRDQFEHDTWIDCASQTVIERRADVAQLLRSGRKSAKKVATQQILAGVERSVELDVGFPLHVFDQFFDESYYASLAENFPPHYFLTPHKDNHFHEDGTFQRYLINVADAPLKGAGHTVRCIWLGLFDAFRDQTVQRALQSRVGLQAKKDLLTAVVLFEDRAGFSMKAHTDGGNGALLTLQIYMPTAASLEDWGTEFYRSTPDGLELTHRQPYVANGAHLFRTSKDSLHGIERPIAAHAEARRLLVLRYFEK